MSDLTQGLTHAVADLRHELWMAKMEFDQLEVCLRRPEIGDDARALVKDLKGRLDLFAANELARTKAHSIAAE
nr:hypothetical protein [uncultured Cohaesibacter sp.]